MLNREFIGGRVIFIDTPEPGDEAPQCHAATGALVQPRADAITWQDGGFDLRAARCKPGSVDGVREVEVEEATQTYPRTTRGKAAAQFSAMLLNWRLLLEMELQRFGRLRLSAALADEDMDSITRKMRLLINFMNAMRLVVDKFAYTDR